MTRKGGGQMLRVILEAVRTRTAQVLTVLILAALAAAAAAAGPWYGLAVASRAAAAQVDTAPAVQRVVSASRESATNGDPRGALTAFAGTVDALLPKTGATPMLGIAEQMIYTERGHGGASSGLAVVYRDGFCAHVRLTGTCPAAAGEVAISQDAAKRIHLSAGQPIAVQQSSSADSVPLRIVAVYQPADPASTYWTDKLFRADGELDPLFTPLSTFTNPQLDRPTLAYDLEIPANLLRGDNGYDLNGVLNQAADRFDAAQLSFANPTGALADRVLRERTTILRSLLIALGQVLVLAWFAIGLAGRYTGRERRGDAALLKLRGNTRFSMVRLTVGQHLISLLGGALIGAPVGLVAASLLAGRLPLPAERWLALAASAAAVAAAVIVGLLVLTVVDAVAQRLPVAVLLRQVSSGRRDWRSDVVDLVLVMVAVGGVYQARSSRPDSGLGLVAPAVVAVAVALVLARLLGFIADRAGGVAVRRGRLRLGLTAVQVSRQPGTDRVFALVVVGVTMFTTAIGGFAAARAERTDRSEVELGATRVLTVQAATRTRLEYAVRTADPGGGYAMAVVVDRTSNPPVLAVDSPRLAAVSTWRPEYGPLGTLPAATAAARPTVTLPLITGTGLTLRVRNDRPEASAMDVILQHEATGAAVVAKFTAIPRGESVISAPVTGCTAAPGCRLVRWQLYTPAGRDGEPVSGSVTVRSLTQDGPPADILNAAALADVARWHTDFTGVSAEVATTARGLVMSSDFQRTSAPGNKVYAVDAPLPLPIVLAGPTPPEWHFQDPSSVRFGPGSTPVDVVGTTGVLPVLGQNGILVDLDSVRRIAADADLGGSFQVWLAADAPPSIVDALRRAGLAVIGDDTAADRSTDLSRQSSVITARFGLLTVVIGLLLAAAAVAIAAAVDRGPQADQLRALRIQGLPRPAAVFVGYAGVAGLVLAGLIGGVFAAVVAQPVANVVATPFADGWRVIAPPSTLTLAAIAVAGLLALLALGLTGWLSARPLGRRLRGGAR
jgi:putative ABC transport system permease protein